MPAFPSDVAALLAQAARALQAGQPAAAIGPLREAARRQPGHATILHDLGLACLESGDIPGAIDALQAAIAADPRFADAHLRLGIALEAAGSPDDALAAYRRAWEARPALADARFRAGDLLESLGRMQEAAAAFRRAAGSAPKSTLGRIAAAKALLAEGHDEAAEKRLRQALALDPGNAAALELLGQVLADAGRFEDARAFLLQAIENAPLRAGGYYDVVRCRPIDAGDVDLVGRMGAAATMPGLEPAQRSRVHLALGKAADDLGDPETAMRHFDAAETLRNGVRHFDLAAFEARIDRLIAHATPALVAPGAGQGDLDATPIVIVGLPRSGTTLVEQILSAHARVHAGGEQAFWNERALVWDRVLAPTAGQDGAAAAEASFLAGAAADYLRLLHGMAPNAARVTDKMPLNFQWAGLIQRALPAATIIHCRRNLLDTALSIHKTHFNPRFAFPTGGPALVGTVRAYQRLMAHWRRLLPPGRFVEIDYEALTAEPEPQIRRLVATCGLAWDPACLYPERNARVVKTPSKWQARQPITRSSVGRWRAYSAWLGPLLDLADGGDVGTATE